MSDRDALLCLFESTKGETWTKKTDWFEEESVRFWYGIKIDEGGHVKSIDLTENRLKGELPNSDRLKRLINLQDLVLCSNLITGTIPNSFGHLKSIIRLHLSWNSLSGPFPMILLELKTLSNLRIDHNKFEGEIPQEIGDLKALEWLDISHNQFVGRLPETMKTYEKLRMFDASSNFLELPDICNINHYRAWVKGELGPETEAEKIVRNSIATAQEKLITGGIDMD